MIFLQMSLSSGREKLLEPHCLFLRTVRLPQSVGNGSRRRLAPENVTHMDSGQAIAGNVSEITVNGKKIKINCSKNICLKLQPKIMKAPNSYSPLSVSIRGEKIEKYKMRIFQQIFSQFLK